MAPRISFFEPASQEDLPAVGLTKPASFEENTHIQSLIRAGIVTHKIKSDETLDTLFAVSQLHDLPEVNFVAAFKEGLILLGCPDAPPARLAGMVEPVHAAPGAPQMSPDTSENLTTLMTRFDSLVEQSDTQHATALDRIESVSRRLEFAADALHANTQNESALTPPDFPDYAPDFTKLTAMIEGLERNGSEELRVQLDQIGTNLGLSSQGAEAQAEQTKALLSQLNRGISTLMDRVADMHREEADTTQTDAPIIDTLAAFRSQLEAVSSVVAKIGDTTKNAQEDSLRNGDVLADLSKVVQHLDIKLNENNTTRISDLSEQSRSDIAKMFMENLDARLPSASDQQFVKEEISALNRRVERLPDEVADASELKVSAQLEKGLAVLGSDIARSAESFQLSVEPFARSADLQILCDKLDHLSLNTSSIPEIISALRADVLNMSKMPSAPLDLTEQRESFARFGTAMGTVVRRLEAAITNVAAVNADAATDTQELHAAMHATLSEVVKDAAANGALPDQIDGMRAELTEIAKQMAGINALRITVKNAAQRPDPVLDLTEQRTAFARFSTVMATVIHRLEGVADQLDATGKPTFDPSMIERNIQEMKTELDAFTGAQSQHATMLLSQIADLSAQLLPTPQQAVTEQAAEPTTNKFSDLHLPIEDLHILFAELIATQMRETAVRSEGDI